MEFAYAGGGLGMGGTATLYADRTKVGKGPIEATLLIIFSAADAFNGAVKGVLLEIGTGEENADHLVSPEDALHVALGRQ